MSGPLVECVPNFSEGRDLSKVDRIAGSIASVPGILLLDRHSDPDHHRSVITFAGRPGAVVEAAVRSAGAAVELIDLTRHSGAHPRIGALDVLPFVPLQEVTLQDCAALAWRAGEAIWERWRVPVYFYGAAARVRGRRNLAAVRRGQFEGLRLEVGRDPQRRPDAGGLSLHPTAGATAVGARRILIAFNVVLGTADVEIARAIARKVRASSGGLPSVQAMGVFLASRGRAQVSMNLTDYERTPPHVVFEAVAKEAARHGIEVTGSEIAGLVPRKALDLTAGYDLRLENLQPSLILERRLAEVQARLRDTMT